ncbi:Lrp/AsnC family transcriptional regulator [Actinomadura sp. NPDC049382]|jgi:DNA-binding Lrp family transcriptional regulator|uniref:Lrp/AsnC family transcriptional regulator n=1 Tax=Actinomadura sp. NPDC049382 TaxID=3158220 RepID=UPI00343820B2
MDELDLAIIDALITRPRVRWTDLAALLDTSPTTLARRWNRIVDGGLAWVTAWPGPALWPDLGMAVIRAELAPHGREEVIDAMVRLPHSLTVQETTGKYDLFVLVLFPGWAALTRSLSSLAALDGIAASRTEICGRLYGSIQWPLGALSAAQRSALAEPRKPLPLGGAVEVDEKGRRLFVELSRDGRSTLKTLAAAFDATAEAEKRRLDRLVGARLLDLRCDMARAVAGWPVLALVWLRVPESSLRKVAPKIAEWRCCRLAVEISGASNLLFALSTHERSQVSDLLSDLEALDPGLRVNEVQYVTLQRKLSGRVLDDEGRASEVIPLDPWYSAQPTGRADVT